MSESWNPTMKTPSGRILEPESRDGYLQPYRKESVLRQHVEDGLCTTEMAEEYGVSKTTILENLRKHDIDIPDHGVDPRDRYETTRKLHDQYGVTWGVNQYANDGEGRVERMADGGHDLGEALNWLCEVHECPDCGRSYPTEKGQHDCMRRHARKLSDQLANDSEVIL